MTDLEVAELIASHKGWVEWVKEHWVWKVGDWFWHNNKPNLVYEYMLKKRHSDGKEFPTIDSILNSNPIPIPREDQLMDMLKSKLGYEDIRFFDLRTELETEEQTCLRIYIKDYNVAKYVFDAPTRLLALFAAVVKVYGLNK